MARVTLALVATSGVALGLEVSGAGSPPAAQAEMASYRPADPLRTTPGQYLAEAKNDRDDIAAHIGHPLGVVLSGVVVNPTQLEGEAVAYAQVDDVSGGTSGAPSKCVIHFNPNFTTQDPAYQKLAIVHEVFHCFEAMDFSTVSAYQAAPAWLIEGEAEWVAATLAPTQLDEWNDYLTRPDRSLFARSYDAIGFYAHLTNSGEDTWHLLDPMLKAGGSAAAYNVAADKTVRLTWASSLARQPSFGKGWQTTGPGITSATLHPGIQDVSVGSDLGGTVAPYTNKLVEFTTSADVVDISATTPYSRLHEADGSEHDDLSGPPNAFCVSQCSMCPQTEAMPRLAPGTTWVAVTGDSSGASYTIAGAKATCAPCLVGHWMVTNLTLITSPGGSHSGGAGTLVDISDDGTAIGNFTPGAPLFGQGGSVKFSGTITDHYGFPSHTTKRSGAFPDYTVSVGTATISVDGSPPQSIKPSSTSGSYVCAGTGLKLTFVGGASTLIYTLVPAS